MEDVKHVVKLQDTVEVNREIMRLIRSKHPENPRIEWDPGELAYYNQLKAETEKASQYLEATASP
jgi:hypothetical protein